MDKLIPILAVLVILGAAPMARAVTADITATADVQTPLSIAGTSDLDFGTVFPGVNKPMPFTDAASAGQWDISGEQSAEITLVFTSLPATLASGPNTLPIVYGAADAAHHTSDAPGSATTFDPSVGTTTNLDAVTGDLYVWIGATVQPPADQVAGIYTGTITLDIAYTGN